MGVLLKVETVMNCFGNRNYMQPMRRLSGGIVFFFWVWGYGIFGFLFVLNVFPKVFPISPHFFIP
jgi:hypothetical protein